MEELRKVIFWTGCSLLINSLIYLLGWTTQSEFILGTSGGALYVLIPAFLFFSTIQLIHHCFF